MKKWVIVGICLVTVVLGAVPLSGAQEPSKIPSEDTTIWATDQALTSDYIIYEDEVLIVKQGVTVYLDEDDLFLYSAHSR